MENNRTSSLEDRIIIVFAVVGLIIMILAFVFAIFLKSNSDNSNNTNNTNNKKVSAESLETNFLKAMISDIELAYNAAYLKCDGNSPTISNVVEEIEDYEIDKSDTTAIKVTDSLGNECVISSENNLMNVTCTNSNYPNLLEESKSHMNLGTCN